MLSVLLVSFVCAIPCVYILIIHLFNFKITKGTHNYHCIKDHHYEAIMQQLRFMLMFYSFCVFVLYYLCIYIVFNYLFITTKPDTIIKEPSILFLLIFLYSSKIISVPVSLLGYIITKFFFDSIIAETTFSI